MGRCTDAAVGFLSNYFGCLRAVSVSYNIIMIATDNCCANTRYTRLTSSSLLMKG